MYEFRSKYYHTGVENQGTEEIENHPGHHQSWSKMKFKFISHKRDSSKRAHFNYLFFNTANNNEKQHSR